MVLPDAEDVEPDLVRELGLLDDLAQALGRVSPSRTSANVKTPISKVRVVPAAVGSSGGGGARRP